MRRFLILLTLLLLGIAFPVFGQTTVNLSVTDTPDNQTWNNGTWSVKLQPPPGNLSQTNTFTLLSGGGSLATQNGTLSGTGTSSMSLPANANIGPAGTVWQFTVCPQASAGCFQQSVTVSTSSPQTLALNPPSIRINLATATPPISAYATGEISGAVIGSQFYLLGTGIQVCSVISGNSCTTWVASGGGISSPSSIPGQPGLTAVPVTSGLIAEYRLLPTENPCAAVDYSGNSNNATGCVGTSPTIITNSGGLSFSINGAVGLPASLNAARTIQIFMSGAPGTFGSPISGASGATSVGLMFALTPQSGDTLLGMDRLFAATMGGTITAYPRTAVPGNTVITWTLDTVDHLFFNGKETSYYFSPNNASAGVQTVGPFQLGGNNGNHFGQSPSYLQGKIYYVAIYNRVLNASEIAANTQYMNNAMAARGITPSISNSVNTATPVYVADGDSITEGVGFGVATPYPSLLTLNQPATGNINNAGVQGLTIAQLLSQAPVSVDPFFQTAPSALVSIFAGTNDIALGTAASTVEANLAAYCNARHIVGWKCIPITMVSRSTFDTGKNSYNALIRQHWAEFADGLADLAADPSLGADGASANTTYIQAGGVHPTQNSHYNDITPVVQRAINRLFGNKDFSSATVYSSAAAAAVATTALSESTNTVTVTFTATPTNCQVGNPIVIAGVTPAGYNSTTANGAGNGAWTIVTRSATQVTYFNPTTGLGAGSVQGTGVCPQQQDGDVYAVLNFGAGNYTLQSCVGLTAQNIYIKNINAVASTIVPFQSSETIDGAANLSIAQNVVHILQAQLISASAAGCTWKVIQ